MNKTERIKLVKAMEYVARQINAEDIFLDQWLTDGVADGDIEYGDLEVRPEDEDEYGAGWYIQDDHFAELMATFLRCMKTAWRCGGLYCDGVVSQKVTVTRSPDPVVLKMSELQDDGDGDPYYILTASDDRIEGYQYANEAAPHDYWINVYLETIGDDLTDIIGWVKRTCGAECRIEKD